MKSTTTERNTENQNKAGAYYISTLPISLDTILLLLLVPTYLYLPLDALTDYLILIALFFYIIVEYWQPIGCFAHLPQRFGRARASFLCRILLVFLLTTLVVILPIAQKINERRGVEEWDDKFIAAYSQLNDGAYQTEIALNYLLEGKNPYHESYANTILKRYTLAGADENPAMYYYVYLPGTLFLSLPFRSVMLGLANFYDQRIVFMGFYALLLLLAPLLAIKPEHKLSLLIGVGLNPYFTDSVVHGMNDIIIVLLVALTMLSLTRKRIMWATLWFSIACCTKQTAWLLGPFFLVSMWQMIPPDERVRQLSRATAIAMLTAALMIGPFLLWDFRSFINSTLLYASGSLAAANYPIRGYNLGWLLVITGIIASPQANFPFWLLQLTIGLPVLIILLRQQFVSGQLNRLLLNAALFIIVFGFLSRFFQGNYVAFVATLIVIGSFMQPMSLAKQVQTGP